jgi:hypothetical protein
MELKPCKHLKRLEETLALEKKTSADLRKALEE